MACKCDIGPGKFEGESALTFMAFEQAMLGNSDISTGDGESGSLVDWLRVPLNLDADQSVIRAALDYGYCQECIDDAGSDIRGGIAVWEDSQGFVYSREFATREEFESALAEAEAEDAASVTEEA